MALDFISKYPKEKPGPRQSRAHMKAICFFKIGRGCAHKAHHNFSLLPPFFPCKTIHYVFFPCARENERVRRWWWCVRLLYLYLLQFIFIWHAISNGFFSQLLWQAFINIFFCTKAGNQFFIPSCLCERTSSPRANIDWLVGNSRYDAHLRLRKPFVSPVSVSFFICTTLKYTHDKIRKNFG